MVLIRKIVIDHYSPKNTDLIPELKKFCKIHLLQKLSSGSHWKSTVICIIDQDGKILNENIDQENNFWQASKGRMNSHRFLRKYFCDDTIYGHEYKSPRAKEFWSSWENPWFKSRIC